MTATLDTRQIGTIFDFTRNVSAAVRVMERAPLDFEMLDHAHHVTEAARAMESARSAALEAGVASQVRLTESARSAALKAGVASQVCAMELARADFYLSDIMSHVGEAVRAMEEMQSVPQFSDVASQEGAVAETPMVEDCDLAAEGQNCAIELLAILIEEDLPESLASNRSALAWELAHAAYNFIVGLMHATALSPEFCAPNPSDLSPLLWLLPRH